MMKEAVIIEAVRTPIGRRNGKLSKVRPDDLLAEVLNEVVTRAGVPAEEVEDVIAGCVSQVGEQAPDIARAAALIAGFPKEVPGVTIDRQCGSSQQAVHFAAQAVVSGDMDVVIACGVESMSRVPMFSNVQGASYSQKLTDQYEIINQGLSAERIAKKWNLSRKVLDEFSLSSHQRAVTAQEEGRFSRELMAVDAENEDGEIISVTEDEGPRKGTTLEKLASLNPAFQDGGVITPGNSSQISDGAAALLIMSKDKAESLGLTPRFKITARSVVGSDPTFMLTGPVAATQKVLKKAGLTLEQMDLYEVNEAFAPVPLYWQKELNADLTKLNVNGGAIALGHPLGASGARVMTTLIHELERTEKRYGLQASVKGLEWPTPLLLKE